MAVAVFGVFVAVVVVISTVLVVEAAVSWEEAVVVVAFADPVSRPNMPMAAVAAADAWLAAADAAADAWLAAVDATVL